MNIKLILLGLAISIIGIFSIELTDSPAILLVIFSGIFLFWFGIFNNNANSGWQRWSLPAILTIISYIVTMSSSMPLPIEPFLVIWGILFGVLHFTVKWPVWLKILVSMVLALILGLALIIMAFRFGGIQIL